MGSELYELRDQAGETLERAASWLGVSKSHLWNCEQGRAALGAEQLSSLQAYYLQRISERMERLGASLPTDSGIQGKQ
jgi:hypothetical protein